MVFFNLISTDSHLESKSHFVNCYCPFGQFCYYCRYSNKTPWKGKKRGEIWQK